MEEQGFIEVSVSNWDNTLSPKDVDISEVKDVISDIETFLFPTRRDKSERPHISYDIEEGSARHKFFLPITSVILFNGLTNEIKSRNNLDFLDYKRQFIIDKFQRKAIMEGYKIEFSTSISESINLTIDRSTSFQMVSDSFFESEFYLYGEIYQEGGKNPNLHISSKEYGNLTISATKDQITEGEKRTYKVYGLKVKGKKSFTDNRLLDLVLIDFIHYSPVFNQLLLNKVIEKASVNLSKITNVDTWINDLRAEGI